MAGNKDQTAARTVTIGDTVYPVSNMSQDAKEALVKVDITDRFIENLEARLSMARTARAKSVNDLKIVLQSGEK